MARLQVPHNMAFPSFEQYYETVKFMEAKRDADSAHLNWACGSQSLGFRSDCF